MCLRILNSIVLSPQGDYDHSSLAGKQEKAALKALGVGLVLDCREIGQQMHGLCPDRGFLTKAALRALGVNSYDELWGQGGLAVAKAEALSHAHESQSRRRIEVAANCLAEAVLHREQLVWHLWANFLARLRGQLPQLVAKNLGLAHDLKSDDVCVAHGDFRRSGAGENDGRIEFFLRIMGTTGSAGSQCSRTEEALRKLTEVPFSLKLARAICSDWFPLPDSAMSDLTKGTGRIQVEVLSFSPGDPEQQPLARHGLRSHVKVTVGVIKAAITVGRITDNAVLKKCLTTREKEKQERHDHITWLLRECELRLREIIQGLPELALLDTQGMDVDAAGGYVEAVGTQGMAMDND